MQSSDVLVICIFCSRYFNRYERKNEFKVKWIRVCCNIHSSDVDYCNGS